MVEENVVEIVESLLDTNWNPDNVTKPQILRQWNPKRVDLSKEDAAIIYETSGLMKEPGDLTYFSEDVTGFVSVDIRTVNSEARFKALYTEIERIRKLKRKAPHVDYDRWDFIRKTLFHRPLSWRGVVDFKLLRANISIDIPYLTVSDFQVNAGTGTAINPERINNGAREGSTGFYEIGKYIEVLFAEIFYLNQFRYHGRFTNAEDGELKLQYYNYVSEAWVDWETNIITIGERWSDWETIQTIQTDKIRFVLTKLDSDGGSYPNKAYLAELEMRYTE